MGLALAPNNFGQLSHDMLIGNFGDGNVDAFDPGTGAFQRKISGQTSKFIIIDGLWGLRFENAQQAGARNTLIFAAGIGEESHGLFVSIQHENR